MEIKLDYKKFKKFLEGSRLVDEVNLDYIVQEIETEDFYKVSGQDINMYSSSDGIAVGTKDYTKSVLNLDYSIEKMYQYTNFIAKKVYAPAND